MFSIRDLLSQLIRRRDIPSLTEVIEAIETAEAMPQAKREAYLQSYAYRKGINITTIHQIAEARRAA